MAERTVSKPMIVALRRRLSQYAHLSFDATKWMVSAGFLIVYAGLWLIMSMSGFMAAIVSCSCCCCCSSSDV